MRKTITTLLSLFIAISALKAQESDKYLDKVNSVDNTITTLYSVISGEKGEERNWELFKYLFHKDAKLIPSGRNKSGDIGARFMTPEDYIDSSGKWLIEHGFFEKEIHRKMDDFGNITQVFSTYESYHSLNDSDPFMRGINSIQLLNDGTRWWIINVFWASENRIDQIPKKYLPN